MILWTREIPSLDSSNFHVVVGGKDILIDSVGILDYLKQYGVSDECITLCEDDNHGKALVVPDYGMRQVLKRL